MTSPLLRLVYASTFNFGRVSHAPSALRDILSSSRRNNLGAGITGYLIFDGETFLQILEGAEAAVLQTFARIEADERHRLVDILTSEAAESRRFDAWSMAGYLRTPQHDEVFREHGIDGKLRREHLTGPQVLGLAVALSKRPGGSTAA